MMHLIPQLLIVTLILSGLRLVISETYYIAPEISTRTFNGSSNNTFSLELLIQRNQFSSGGSMTLIFLPGIHPLSRFFTVRNFTFVQLIGEDNSVILFKGNSSIQFTSIGRLNIQNLNFTSEIGTTSQEKLTINDVANFSISECYFSRFSDSSPALLYIRNTQNTSIDRVSFKNNLARALYVQSGNAVRITNSVFKRNRHDVAVQRCGGSIKVDSTNIVISKCTFLRNNASYGGAICALPQSTISISNSVFDRNSASKNGGAIYVHSSDAYITDSELTSNRAMWGGALSIFDQSNVSVSNSSFKNNNGTKSGGGIYARFSDIYIADSELTNNRATQGGMILIFDQSNMSISNSLFENNSASEYGGGIYSHSSNIYIADSELTSNSAKYIGGAIYADESNGKIFSIFKCNITNNSAHRWGGGVYYYACNAYIVKTVINGNKADWGGGINIELGTLNIFESELTGNRGNYGAAMYSYSSVSISDTVITNNVAKAGALFIQQSVLTFRDTNVISDNSNSSIYALNCVVRFDGPTKLNNNHGNLGGAIFAVQSQIYFNAEIGKVLIVNNKANFGGGIFLRETTLFVHYPVQISFNTASNGGGIFAYLSSIKFESGLDETRTSMITSNTAYRNGGGIFAIASTVTILHFFLYVDRNNAMSNGGGIYLQQSSKVQIFKQWNEDTTSGIYVMLHMGNNTAHSGHGGGIYVDDSTEIGGTCRGGITNELAQSVFSECFIQTLNLYDLTPYNGTVFVNTFLTNNTAKFGSNVYGGLLDRCTLNPFAEFYTASNGLEYFRNTVNFSSNLSVASDPVEVSLCNGSEKSSVIIRGGVLKINVMAVDQVGNPVNATIRSSVISKSGVGRLKEGQTEQRVGNQCTEIEYNVFSQDSAAQVELYADGPCANLGKSTQSISITFLPCTCPVGFQQTNDTIECICDCDPDLQQHQISECSHDQETVRLETNIWIGVDISTTLNMTSYIVSDCPFDYCVEKPFDVVLGNQNEIDRQCDYNRSGVLCGECEEGLSLVLGTSKCLECSNLFLSLLIPFAVLGVALVAFILLLNITIATGTIHGLVFYANIVAANRALFLPRDTSKFLKVFIHWINLDLGIETCFYDGMNSQAKVLFQLVFPAYLFLLIFLIIILSKYFDSFSKLLSNRNPVAALGTLILLSYSKLLRFIIAALQSTVLDSSHGMVWSYNGNVRYFSREHIPQFVAAIIILAAGGLFTVLLFFGQWFPLCSERKLMKWTKNTKYIGFMDAYHAPFTPKHRYWVGLLLLALIIHNLVTSFSPNPYLPVISAGCLPVGIIVFKAMRIRVYKKWWNEFAETLFLLNLIFLAFGTLYTNIKTVNSTGYALSNISVGITFVLFLVFVIGYHVYEFILKKTGIFQKLSHSVRNVARDKRQSQNLNGQETNKSHETINANALDLPASSEYHSYVDGDGKTMTSAQLRLSYIDDLSPVVEGDYIIGPSSEFRSKVRVTHTVVEFKNITL
ncbi:uncharacterized protein LOC135337933 [Halichondria panicea]|uniref:uncharacterized protein LOC135337933 n=1 Tax=Halichondria panicea TaxID=6063 RepID=UPI00312B3162